MCGDTEIPVGVILQPGEEEHPKIQELVKKAVRSSHLQYCKYVSVHVHDLEFSSFVLVSKICGRI